MGGKFGKKISQKTKGINMSVAKELFEKTNALAGTLGKNGRVEINPPPQRKRKNVKASIPATHRYGSSDRPPPLSELSQRERKKISTAPARTPMAFCPMCNCDVPMKWKAREKRGKDAKSWFMCAICACEHLEIKY
jgi:hypothetical protein